MQDSKYISSVMRTVREPAQLQQIQLYDYSHAQFGTFFKSYFGTSEDIAAFLAEVDRIPGFQVQEPYPRIESRILEIRSSIQTAYKFHHFNVWNWPYEVSCETIESVHLWIQSGDRFYRCMKARLSKPSYYCEDTDTTHNLGSVLWGYPGILKVEDVTITNRLYVVEKVFKKQEEMRADILAFDGRPLLTQLLDEIFGGG